MRAIIYIILHETSLDGYLAVNWLIVLFIT